jgi:hypothetical protein
VLLLGCAALVAFFSIGRAADDKIKVAVEKADDERGAATKAADRARLEAIYSDSLHYAHSSGRVDTTTSQIQGKLTSGNTYEAFEYKERTIIPAGPGVAIMKGRVNVHMRSKSGEKTVNDINYLAVWREENGKWRFLAWQASKNPSPADAKK